MKHQPVLNSTITYSFNIINMMRLRDHLAWTNEEKSKPDIGFNMANYVSFYRGRSDRSGHECGTCACIAGHALLLKGYLIHSALGRNFYDAKEWLGLTHADAYYLFMGQFERDESWLDAIPLKAALDELNYIIDHGHTSERT